MKILEGKRLAAIFAAYIALFAVFVWLPMLRSAVWLLALLIVALFAAVLYFVECPHRLSLRKAASVFLMILFSVTAVFRGAAFIGRTEASAERYLDGVMHNAEGYVSDIHYDEPYGSSYDVVLAKIDGEAVDFSVSLSLPFAGGFSVRDTVSFEGVFGKEADEYESYRKAKGVLLSVTAEDIVKTGQAEKGIDAVFERLRTVIGATLERYISDDARGFAAALLTGDRSALDGVTKLAYTRLGISHILAVSGLHLSVIVGGADMLLRLLTVPKKKKNGILIVLSILFACICGLSASIVRAAIMLSLYYFSELIGEKSDSVTSLFFSVFVIIFVHPTSVYDIGLWLSFLSTFGILTVTPIISDISFGKKWGIFGKGLRALVSLVCMTLAATFFTMPVTYLCFGGISLISPLANLVFVPLTEIILYLLVLLNVLGFIPVLASFLGKLASMLIAASSHFAARLSDIEGIYISIRYPFVKYILAALVLGIFAVLFTKKWKPSVMFAVFLSCGIAFGGAYAVFQSQTSEQTYVFLQTDGKSDVLGIVNNGKTMLVDISTGGASVSYNAVKHLADFYEYEINTFLLTHYHSYHAATIKKLCETVKIHCLLLPTPQTEKEKLYLDGILSAVGNCCEIAYYERSGDETVSVGDAFLYLPRYETLKRSEHPLIVFSLSVGERSLLYVGESGFESAFLDTEQHDAVICGANGPVTHHIFDERIFSSCELLIFCDSEIASYTETEDLSAEIAYANRYDGYIRIIFE